MRRIKKLDLGGGEPLKGCVFSKIDITLPITLLEDGPLSQTFISEAGLGVGEKNFYLTFQVSNLSEGRKLREVCVEAISGMQSDAIRVMETLDELDQELAKDGVGMASNEEGMFVDIFPEVTSGFDEWNFAGEQQLQAVFDLAEEYYDSKEKVGEFGAVKDLGECVFDFNNGIRSQSSEEISMFKIHSNENVQLFKGGAREGIFEDDHYVILRNAGRGLHYLIGNEKFIAEHCCDLNGKAIDLENIPEIDTNKLNSPNRVMSELGENRPKTPQKLHKTRDKIIDLQEGVGLLNAPKAGIQTRSASKLSGSERSLH
jgi:hypothetical protein